MKKILEKNFWIWSALLTILLVVFICLMQQKVSINLIWMNLLTTGIMVILSMGQMAVITGGEGAIDLGLVYNTALAGYVFSYTYSKLDSYLTVKSSKGISFIIAMIIAVLLLSFVGFLNGILTVYLKIPAIITTLASSYIVYTVLLLMVPVVTTTPPKALVSFIRFRAFGIYSITIVALVLMMIFWFIIHKTTFGFRLQATGQNTMVAKLAGIHVKKIRIITFVISGFFCSVAGILLCGYSGGAFVDMASSYHPGDVAAVVLGGTLISGGKCNVVGIWFGAMVMVFLGTAMDISGLSIGMQEMIKGLVLVLMLAASVGKKETQDSID